MMWCCKGNTTVIINEIDHQDKTDGYLMPNGFTSPTATPTILFKK